jgi:hypothetical protein
MGKFDSRMQHIEAWVIAGAIALSASPTSCRVVCDQGERRRKTLTLRSVRYNV